MFYCSVTTTHSLSSIFIISDDSLALLECCLTECHWNNSLLQNADCWPRMTQMRTRSPMCHRRDFREAWPRWYAIADLPFLAMFSEFVKRMECFRVLLVRVRRVNTLKVFGFTGEHDMLLFSVCPNYPNDDPNANPIVYDETPHFLTSGITRTCKPGFTIVQPNQANCIQIPAGSDTLNWDLVLGLCMTTAG